MREIVTELVCRGAFVVMGGPWITVKEDYFEGLVDAFFIGEAEQTWPRFLEDWQRGERQNATNNPEEPTCHGSRRRVRSGAVSRLPLGSIQSSRGCPFQCEFCDIIVTFFGRKPSNQDESPRSLLSSTPSCRPGVRGT